LTKIPLSEAEKDYEKTEALRFLNELKSYKAAQGIDFVEIISGNNV
jgi:hypothetical protein